MAARSDIRPLRTSVDYAWAIEEIEKVLNANYNSPEGERLELLSILVSAYEERCHAIPPPTPEQARAWAQEQGHYRS